MVADPRKRVLLHSNVRHYKTEERNNVVKRYSILVPMLLDIARYGLY